MYYFLSKTFAIIETPIKNVRRTPERALPHVLSESYSVFGFGCTKSPAFCKIGFSAAYSITAIKIATTAFTNVETAVHLASRFAVTSSYRRRNR